MHPLLFCSFGFLAFGSCLSSVSLSAAPTAATVSPTIFTLQWRGVPNPQSNDWVAQYCVDTPDVFGPWAYVNVCAAWATGDCSIQLSVSDPLAQGACTSLYFALYRDPSPYTLLGKTPAISWNTSSGGGDSTPRHTRLAYGTDPTSEMHFSFSTNSSVDGARVSVGLSSGSYDVGNFSSAAAVTYLAGDSCGAPSNWRFPGYFHHALLTGLKANTRYFALPSQGGTAGTETSFVTGKPRGAAIPVRAIVYGDMGTSGGNGAVATATHIKEKAKDADFILHVGDLSYGEGNVGIWEEFMTLIEPTSSILPYHISIGNHEYDYTGDSSKDPSGAGKMYSPSWWNGGGDSGGECGVPSSRRFRTPQTGNGVFWYSFGVGSVHVIMISSEHDPSPGTAMGDWIEGDLAAVDRSVTPWVVLGMHRPIVETEQYASDFAVAAGLRGILEPLLLAWRVDVVLAGHYHSFQRSCVMANLTCVKEGAGSWGILHYTTGAAGAGLDSVPVYPSTYISKTIEGTFGYSILEANATTLTLSFFENEGDTLADFVALQK